MPPPVQPFQAEVPMTVDQEMGQELVDEEPLQHQESNKYVDKDTMSGSHLVSPSDLEGFPVFPDGTKSLLSKLMTRDDWAKYKDVPGYAGYGFRECIFSGC